LELERGSDGNPWGACWVFKLFGSVDFVSSGDSNSDFLGGR